MKEENFLVDKKKIVNDLKSYIDREIKNQLEIIKENNKKEYFELSFI